MTNNTSTEKKIQTSAEYIHSMHKIGRIIALVSIIILMGMPFAAAIYFDAMPSWGQIITASAALLAIFIPTNIGEVISYTPVLGSSVYLTFLTGNLSNLKFPVATNAIQNMDASYGTEEADIISAITVGISSFVTIVVIILGVILMIPLQPILALPTVKTATAYILPALFGNLVVILSSPRLGGGITSPNRLKGALMPTLLVIAIALLDKMVWHIGIMSRYQGVVVVALLPLLYYNTKYLFSKGKIKVLLPGEKE